MHLHRNSQKRIIYPGMTYFVTTNTKYRYPYFRNDILSELFIEELRVAKELKKFLLFGFCVMPDHIHLLLKPDVEVANISEIMRSLKTNFSRNVNKIVDAYNLNSFMEIEGRVTSPGLRDCNYNKILIDKFFKLKKQNIKLFYFKWHDRFHDHFIRNHRDFKII
jgi:REP element-mobilizing transposase RayT